MGNTTQNPYSINTHASESPKMLVKSTILLRRSIMAAYIHHLSRGFRKCWWNGLVVAIADNNTLDIEERWWYFTTVRGYDVTSQKPWFWLSRKYNIGKCQHLVITLLFPTHRKEISFYFSSFIGQKISRYI